MCTCFRGFTLADNGRTCRRLHDYRNSPCSKRSQTQGRPCTISPHDQMSSVVRPPQPRPCELNGDPCGSSSHLDFGSQTPCGPGFTPCDSFNPEIPEIPVSTDHLPPCRPDTQPCGSKTPCRSETKPCIAVPKIPPVLEEFPLLPGCMDSNCNPPFSQETIGDRQDQITQFTSTKMQPEPCISGPCPFLPEMPPGNYPLFDSNIQNPSPCLSSTCVHNSNTPIRNTEFIEPTTEFVSSDIPPFPDVPRGTYPCPRSGCRTGYNSQDVSTVFHQSSDLMSKPPYNIARKVAPCQPGSSCEVVKPLFIEEFVDKAAEQTPMLLSALKRPSYELEPITENQDERDADQQHTRGNNDTDRSKDHNKLHAYESNTKASPTILPFIDETSEATKVSRIPIKQSDQSLIRRLHQRKKLKMTRKNRRRRKNKRKHRQKIARTGKPKRLRNKQDSETVENEPSIYRTTPPLSVEYTSGSPTTVSTLGTTDVQRSNFEDKVKSFLTEFNRLRGKQGALSQTGQHHEKGIKKDERRSGERRRQGRICRGDLCTSYVSTSPTHPPVPPAQNTSPNSPDINSHSSLYNAVLPTPTQRSESVKQRVICANDQVAVDVPGGAICQKRFNGTIPLPTCPPGQTVTRSRMGYVCAAAGELRPVCGNGTTLNLVMGRYVCEETDSNMYNW
ncbi:uncharacterized protein LOC117341410 [Pecten maximus]|uniref:uncharacterized protein LOC117341410 n=1 Tax=Pecten maximus TaxID=6579 RepID=UPI0014582319|nr:uncharacterized protein LOC117341410 [Pecten maximus]